MDLKKKLISIISIFTCLISLSAQEVPLKQAMKSNGVLIYADKTLNVDTFTDMFLKGNVYGRLRNNNFYFAYNHEDVNHVTQVISGIGGNVVYKSARLSGFSFDVGLYGSYSFFNEMNDPISVIKAGKDTLSRFNYVNDGDRYMAVFGQASMDYQFSQTDFRLGRQLVETFYTKSNDTRMIPNTFDGLVLITKNLPQTTLKAAYLYKQKLRDHTKAHSVLMMGDSNSSSSLKPNWSENDDGAMHRGLTYTALKNAGKPTDAPLIVLDAENKSIDNLKINFSSYVVPELLSQGMLELNYKIKVGSLTITPAVRYMQQFDNGAGAVGGASLSGNATNASYKNPNSLNAKMIAARVVTKIDEYKINLGYTNILDEADLVTPWRGFLTAGYTRSMGMYNWRANTKSYRLEVVKSGNKTGVYKDTFVQASILYIDGDAKKSDFPDNMYYYIGFIKNISALPELQARLRLAYRDFMGDSLKSDSNYLDSRLEFNYLF